MTVANVVLFLASSSFSFTLGFIPTFTRLAVINPIHPQLVPSLHGASDSDSTSEPIDAKIIENLDELTPEQQEQVGNLVADDVDVAAVAGRLGAGPAGYWSHGFERGIALTAGGRRVGLDPAGAGDRLEPRVRGAR